MPKIAMRDQTTRLMVPILGGVDKATADAKFLPLANAVMEGCLTAPHPTAPTHVATQGYVDHLTPVGTICALVGAAAPLGWVLCQGAAISRGFYSALFAVIGTRYGVGDGSTTFNLPDLRGRVVVGIGSSAYFDARGEKQGEKTVALAKSQVPNFSGQWEMHNAALRTMIYAVSGSITPNLSPGAYATGYQNSGSSSIGYANLNMGFGGGAHNNISWSMALNFIVRT